jgi:2',3'-cyclic-nucleotide 2'-phosphodiesterase (5'-nucleotidase family)
MAKLAAPVIACNFHDTATGHRLFAPAVTLEKDGVRVAFIGIADPTTTVRQPPTQVRGLDSTRMDGLREFVKATHEKERADLVVIISHSGLTVSRQLTREIPEFDVILSGHTHERTVERIIEGKVIIVEPGAMASFLGRLFILSCGGSKRVKWIKALCRTRPQRRR